MQNGRYPNSKTIHRQQLANGIVLLVYENFASPSVVVEGIVRAGSLAETAVHAGLANLTAGCLMRGSQNRTFEQIYDQLESTGVDLAFSGGSHVTAFSGYGLAEDIDLMLDVAADVLRYPRFAEAEVEHVRGQLLTGLQMRANDTSRMANLALAELIYEGHPYGRSGSGYIETVQNLTRQQLADFHTQFYGPQGMILTVVGAIKAEEAAARVTAVLGDWHNPQQQPLPTVPDMPRPQRRLDRLVPMPNKHQADIQLGLPGPSRAAADYLDANLMNSILGVFGMMGRIGKSVREEKGLAYYAYSQLTGSLGPSPWLAAAGVAPEAVPQAIQAILDEIERMQNEPVSAEELADNQAYRTGSLPMSLETNGGLSDVILDMELYGLGADYLLEFSDKIWAITPAQIQAAAQKYLSTTQLGVAVAGPTAVEIADADSTAVSLER